MFKSLAPGAIGVRADLPRAAELAGKYGFAGVHVGIDEIVRLGVAPTEEILARHGVRVEYVAGNSTDTLAKLQAQRANQQIDVAFMDDGPMYLAIQLGFCAPISSLPADDIVPAARFPGDRAVGVGIVGTGLMYNTQYFRERGWAPPTSWNDLADPKYRGLIVIPPINNTYGLHTLVMFARMAGGGEANIEPGFKAMKERVNPNVLAYEPSPGKMTELFQSGQAALAGPEHQRLVERGQLLGYTGGGLLIRPEELEFRVAVRIGGETRFVDPSAYY